MSPAFLLYFQATKNSNIHTGFEESQVKEVRSELLVSVLMNLLTLTQ